MECIKYYVILMDLVILAPVTKKTQKSKRRKHAHNNTCKDGQKRDLNFKVKPRDEEKSRGDQSPSKQMQLKAIQKIQRE
jgi:hypothetical protein